LLECLLSDILQDIQKCLVNSIERKHFSQAVAIRLQCVWITRCLEGAVMKIKIMCAKRSQDVLY